MKKQDYLKAVKELYDLCIDLPEEQQRETLTKTTYDKDVIEKVTSLLSLTDSDEMVTPQLDIIANQMSEATASLEKQKMLGAYQIEQEIGRGGMGVVFLAHRADGQYEQKVAIKIAPSFASQKEQERFQQERQTLAKLQHPNIAMLLDGGITDEDRPYLVMEYIKGETILDYCQKRQLGISERLGLFQQVCDALTFAHNQLIIHRDIKPDNILITTDGQVKLLDFGISKVMQSALDNNTVTQQVGLTLHYASPEQIKGEPSTIATDVYGLGGLLYSLLSESTPFENDQKSVEQLISTICLTEPKRPSKRALSGSTNLSAKQLKGDLDNITLKALRKEPQHRYSTVQALKEDIERYLNNEPVNATSASLSYRISKLFSRHPVASSMAVALVLSLVTGLGVSINLTYELDKERNELAVQVETSERVVELLTDMFDAASPERSRGKDINVETLLNDAITKTRNELQTQPLVKIKLFDTLAEVHKKIGKYPASLELVEEVIQLKSNTGQQATARDLTLLADLHRSISLFDDSLGYIEQAEQRLIEYPSPGDQASLMLIKASYFYDKSEFEKALSAVKQAKSLIHLVPINQQIAIEHLLAKIYMEQHKEVEAKELYEQLLVKIESELGPDHPKSVNVYASLSQVYRHLNLLEEQGEAIEKAYTLANQYFDPNLHSFYYIVINYSEYLKYQGFYQDSINVLTDKLTPELTSKNSRAMYLSFAGISQLTIGEYDLALLSLIEAEKLQTKLDSALAFTFNTQVNLGLAKGLTGDVSTGLNGLRQIKTDAEKLWGKATLPITSADESIAKVLLGSGDLVGARDALNKVANTYVVHGIPESHPAYLSVFDTFTDLHMAEKKWLQAQQYNQKATALVEQTQVSNSVIRSFMKLKEGVITWHLGDKDKGRNLVLEFSTIVMEQLEPSSVYYQQAKEWFNQLN